MEIDDKTTNMIGAHLDGVYRFSARENCDELLNGIFQYLFTLRDALFPRPEIKDCIPLVLYFDSRAEADEFIDLVQQAKPGMKAHTL